MRYVDADKLYPDCRTIDGKLAISQSQLANAKTASLPDFKDGYKQAIIDGKTNFARPQGEWKETDIPESVLCKCSVCGFDLGAYSFNFCPNCGAEMRGKA